jgi:hypothetical protein
MNDPSHDQTGAESEDQRERRQTWPSLVAAAAMVGFWTAVIGGIGAMNAASQADPADRHASALVFSAVAAAVIGLVGWIAQRIFLATRRAPINDVLNFGVIAVVAVAAMGPALLIARSDLVHHEMTRESANRQALAIDEAYSQGIFAADEEAGLALSEALGDGLIQSHLHDRSSLPDLRERIQRARLALSVYESRVADLQGTALQQVREADMSSWEREHWLESFNLGFEGTRPIFEQRLQLHRRLLDLQEQQIDVLDRGGAWNVGGPGIEFTDVNDLASFNDLANEIAMTSRELEMLDQRAASMSAEYEANRPRY